MTVELWALAGVLVLAMILVALGAADYGNPDRVLPRRPPPLPKHAKWTGEGATTRLTPPMPRPEPMERDGGQAQRITWPE